MRTFSIAVLAAFLSVSAAEAFTLSSFEAPESVLVDPDDGSYYVSNVVGELLAKDGNGYISKINGKGNLVIQHFLGGKPGEPLLDAPKGMALVGSKLYVSDIDSVKIFDKETRKLVDTIDLSAFEVKFLNDLASDAFGNVYASDMTGNKILKIETRRQNAVTVFKASEELGWPNGLLVNPKTKNLMVATWQTGSILEVDHAGRIHVLKRGLGELDGLDYDKDGNLFVSSFERGEVYQIGYFGRGRVSSFLTGLNSPADLAVDRKRDEILIPSLKGNKVASVPRKKAPPPRK